jgi:hypothetical protein
MSVLAHIGVLPVEELLPLACAACTALAVRVRGWPNR